MKRTGIGMLVAIVLFFLFALVVPLNITIDYSTIVTAKDGTVMRAYLTKDGQWRMKARLEEITPELEKAIVFKEDKHFYHHLGVNPLAVLRAVYNNIFHLKRTSGASTITMQVSRMLQPKPRTYLNKCIEMFRATQLELHYSKREILQLYLNLVPYGSNIQGVKAASLFFFNKSPDQLSLAEITALSIIPNRPNSMVMGKHNDLIVIERNRWLRRFADDKLFPISVVNDALSEPLIASRHATANIAPQFTWRMHKSYPFSPEIHTTVDVKLQQKAERIVSNYIGTLKLRNINNAAVLIVDNKTHEVITYIGSSDFSDRFNHGQVDGVKALRSPGSALKPLLYGMSLDNGIITPKTVIADVPVNFDGYTPENYDLDFRGNITAEDALRMSLNIPAVKLLHEVGTENFINKLGRAGFTSIAKNKKKMGLSMILGGCDVRLEEMTDLYSSFANDGKYYPLKWTISDSVWMYRKMPLPDTFKGVAIVSPASNYMLTHILSELHRPDLPNDFEQAQGIPKIAWKTGTSYGHRDAWSIGYNARYTIGIWIGNFSGTGVPGLSGAGIATPLLFQLFNSIDHNASNDWIQPPSELAFRLVCAKTGKLPSPECNDQVMDYYIPGVSNSEYCNHLKQVWLTVDEKYTYCTTCLPASGYKTKEIVNVSPELAAFYNSRHISYEKIPPHNPKCSRMFNGQAPVITSLTNGLTYLVADKGKQQLELACSISNDVGKVYWYVNNTFISAAKPTDKIFFNPSTANIKISCVDDKGRNTDINIKVKFI